MSGLYDVEHFPLEMLAYGRQSQPASISRQGFAGKSLQSNLLISFENCSIAILL
jgi:hypothetical protein